MKRFLLTVLLVLVLLPGFGQTKPHTFSPNDPVSSAKINANFDTVYQWCNELATRSATLYSKTLYASSDTSYPYWHKNNDGSGSGLDADTVDGINSLSFVLKSDQSYIQTNSWSSLRIQTASGYIDFGPANPSWAHIYTDRAAFYLNKDLYVNNNLVWNSNNDGDGSGLDADTLDGYHLSTTANAANTIPVRNSSGYLYLGWINTTSGSAGTTAPDRIYGSYDSFLRYYTPDNFKTVMGLTSASNLTSGTLPNARLSGTYDGITVKLNGTNTIISEPNTGTQSPLGRTASHLAEYRNSSSAATGCIVFSAPNNTSTIMSRFEIEGMLYSGAPTLSLIVQGYRTTGTWSNYCKVNRGLTDPMVRLGVNPSGYNCIILGDTTTTWSYPHIIIKSAMFSHTNASDDYCKGWTTTLTTSLTGYTNVTSAIESESITIPSAAPSSPMDGAIWTE